MFLKYLKISTGKTFIVNQNASAYLEDDKDVKLIGPCSESGEVMDHVDFTPPKKEKQIDENLKTQIEEVSGKKSSKKNKKDKEEKEQNSGAESFEDDDEA